MPLDEGLAEVVAVGKDASNPPQVDPGGYRKMEYRAVLHRAMTDSSLILSTYINYPHNKFAANYLPS